MILKYIEKVLPENDRISLWAYFFCVLNLFMKCEEYYSFLIPERTLTMSSSHRKRSLGIVVPSLFKRGLGWVIKRSFKAKINLKYWKYKLYYFKLSNGIFYTIQIKQRPSHPLFNWLYSIKDTFLRGEDNKANSIFLWA